VEKKIGKHQFIFFGLIIILIISALVYTNTQTNQEKNYYMPPSIAHDMFKQFVTTQYTAGIVNQPSCFAEEYCGSISKEINFNEGLFRYLKEEKRSTLDKNLLSVYCECISDDNKCVKNPAIFKCINKNEDIIQLFYSSPSPCINYTFYILHKLTDSIEDLIKPEFLVGSKIKEKTETNLTIYSMVKYPLYEKIIIEPTRIILRSEQYTCP
jgi:hypothetical protein